MLAPWVIEEMKEAKLEKRLNARLAKIVGQFANQPTASIPAACGGFAEITAAYRFFANKQVTFEVVLAPHSEATRRRIAEQRRVILVQDTTEMDLTKPERVVSGSGPLDGSSRRGCFLHPLVAFTPEGTPLGTLHAEVWVRADEPLPDKAERAKKRDQTPIEDKESYRWLETLRRANAEAQQLPNTHVIGVADSEADIFEVLVEAQAKDSQADWVVRACQNRALVKPPKAAAGQESEPQKLLREQVLKQAILYTDTVEVRGREAKVSCEKRARRQPRQARTANVEVRAAQVCLRPPWRSDRKLPEVIVNVVLVTEVDPPADDVPVEWLLLSSLPIATADEVRQVIQAYRVRWLIEVMFRTLKSGCRVEARRFEHIDRFLPCLAVYLIVTWRTLFVCRLGRECPEASCEVVFEPAEWKSVYTVVLRQPPPAEPPTLQEMVRLVARLGGYVNRPRTDEPGPQTVWLGLQRLHDIATCWQSFGPGSKNHQTLM